MRLPFAPFSRRELVRRVGAVAAGAAALPAFGRAFKDEGVGRFAFGSCAKEYLPQPIWDAVGAARPDAFFFLGDAVYGDTTDMAVLRRKFAQLDAVAGFRRFRAETPVFGTWDDHDFGGNDAGDDYPKRVESQQVFLDFLRVPAASPRRRQEGVYDATWFGGAGRRVQVLLLDLRYHRDPLTRDGANGYTPDDDPAKTFLGPAQWAWLRAQLARPAELRIIVSSIQMLSEEHVYEKWMNFPRERERLFDAIRAASAAGCVFVSGDRHFGELARFDGSGVGYPLYEMTTSSLTHTNPAGAQEANRHRLAGSGVGVNNFGLVSVDWQASGGPAVALELRDVAGKAVARASVALADLQA